MTDDKRQKSIQEATQSIKSEMPETLLEWLHDPRPKDLESRMQILADLDTLTQKLYDPDLDDKGFREALKRSTRAWRDMIDIVKNGAGFEVLLSHRVGNGETRTYNDPYIEEVTVNRPEHILEAAHMVAVQNTKKVRYSPATAIKEIKRLGKRMHETATNQGVFLCRCDAWRVAWREAIRGTKKV